MKTIQIELEYQVHGIVSKDSFLVSYNDRDFDHSTYAAVRNAVNNRISLALGWETENLSAVKYTWTFPERDE